MLVDAKSYPYADMCLYGKSGCWDRILKNYSLIQKLFDAKLSYSFPYSWKLFCAMILYNSVFKIILERFESEKMIKGNKHKV